MVQLQVTEDPHTLKSTNFLSAPRLDKKQDVVHVWSLRLGPGHHAVMAFIFSHTVNVIYVSPGE